MKTKRVLTVLLCLFAVMFTAVGLVDIAAKDRLYSALFANVNYEYTKQAPREVKLKKGDFLLYGEYLGEQVLWNVISEDGTLLQSEYVIDFAGFGKSSDWETSELKKTLAENLDEIEEEPFLLSQKELSKLSAAERKKQPTATAASRVDTRFLFLRKNCWYWTSSGISTNSLSVAAVTQSGTFYKSPANDALMGVCPALRLNGNPVSVVYGDGSREKPYVIGGENE